MQAENITMPFDDAPRMEQVKVVITGWYRPELPNGLENLVVTPGTVGENVVWGSLAEMQSGRYKGQLEVKAISWLYDFIRANVKRGRVFDLGGVLRRVVPTAWVMPSYSHCWVGYLVLMRVS